MASQTSFASNSNNHRYHSHNRQTHTRQCFPRLSSRRNGSCSYGAPPTPSTAIEPPAVQNASVPAPNPVKNLETLPTVNVGTPATGLTQDSATSKFQSASNCTMVPKSPGSAAMHVPDSSMNQFTPEQQQWMYLSQQTQNFLPFTQNVLAAQFKEHFRFPETSGTVSMPGKTCEEIERDQAVQTVLPERCALCHMDRVNQNTPASRISAPYPSVPTAPVLNNNWPSLPLEGPLDQQAISVLHKMAESLYYELHGLYLIPLKKEECPLNATGQCPFGFSCFFEHPERGTSESGKSESGKDEE